MKSYFCSQHSSGEANVSELFVLVAEYDQFPPLPRRPMELGRRQLCKDGFYGLDCSSPCDKNCDEGCNMTSGFCTRCKKGFWGPELCHYNCSAHCAGPTCQRDDGNCEVCREGFYGPDCSSACHQNCVGGCDKINGHCTRCKAGKYGSDCLMDCGNCRGDTACNATSGVCPGGCAPGWTKPLCTEGQVSSSRSNTPLIGGAAGGVVVLIALCVVIAIIIIRFFCRICTFDDSALCLKPFF
ncbi:scavenger receptor class F member 1-like [Littorina saxatilis]|uniref:scavenger receptor class F member 1-like n=1 Tax=Littorina saxatilis TaxID=31220 RepID=UPI0038B5BBE7